MKFSESWLREWVNPQLSTNELAEQISMAGLEVDGIETDEPKRRSVKQTLEHLERLRQGRAPDTDVAEAVSRIRALRDEWED